MTFTAVIDETDNTKTLLEGAVGDGFRNVLWQPGDAIGVVSAQDDDKYNYSSVEKFVATIEEPALSSEFDGAATFSSSYKAFYPYSETVRDSSNCFIFNLPSQQKYVANSFDPAAAPMVAVANYGETFKFRNLCGVLALQLTGEEAVKSIVFSGYDEAGNMIKVSGQFEVDPHQETLSVVPLWKSYGSVTMTCDKPVQLDPVNPTAFHIVLPAGTYSSFTVMILTEDNVMLKQATNPLTIKRAEVQPTAALMYVETVSVDLSKAGTANSYIVNGPGLYSFDASVIGNGIYGFIEDVYFHTDSPYINPVKAEMLWEDRVGVLGSVACDDERVTFTATGKEGNALIAVTDNNGQILWSWHIWVTDQPQEQVYVNSTGNYSMMDRNLGAIRADRGADNDFYDAHGLLFQWGRKDPFAIELSDIASGGYRQMFTAVEESTTLSESIKDPTRMNVVYADTWEAPRVDSLWSSTKKTIYDPCPVGYTIPVQDVWSALSFEGNDPMLFYEQWYPEVGAEFYYDGVNTTFYPLTGYVNHYKSLYFTPSIIDYTSFMWSSIDDAYGDNKTSYACGFTYRTYPSGAEWIALDHQQEKSEAHAVRCMKDAGYESTCVPMVKIKEIKDIVVDGARVEAKISAIGLTPVTECGIIWGTSSDITLENASYQSVDLNSDEFSYTITGLEKATRYYVRAYAKNESGIGYSEVKYFITDWEGDAFDLSKGGTANCYIVTPYYAEYKFNASVKGNSTEPVGEIASVEVLWETPMNYNSINVGDIIDNVEIDGNEVHFTLPREPIPGNALVAVKDVNGSVLWSWHIWIVDYDPESKKVTLNNGAVIMDRNLGAISAAPGANEAIGFMYQWGRKDPFPYPEYNFTIVPSDRVYYDYYDPSVSIESTIPTPHTVYDGAEWDYDSTLWGINKTKYDPCPRGWKVSERGIWNGMHRADNYNSDYYELDPTCSDTYVSFPVAGRSEGTDYLYGSSCDGHMWTSTRGNYARIYIYDSYIYVYDNPVDHGYGVRCMKDADTSSDGSDDFTQSDDYEW